VPLKDLIPKGSISGKKTKICFTNVDTDKVFAKLTLTYKDGETKRSHMCRDLGISVLGYALPMPDIRSPKNLANGAIKRILHQFDSKHQIDKQVLRKFRNHVRYFIRQNFTPIPLGEDMSFETWLDKCKNYNEQRKDELRKVYDEMDGVIKLCQWDRTAKTFVKNERYEELKYPRLINAMQDTVKISLGPAAKILEEVVYSNDHSFCIKFIKHVPMWKRIDYIERLCQRTGAVYKTTDYSSFECSFSSEFMECAELQFYAYMLRNYPDQMHNFRLLTGWNRCTTKRGVYFKVKGRRMSGEMVTSLGNGISNMLLLSFISHEVGATLYGGVVEGDDGLFSSASNVPIEETRKLGFIVKQQSSQMLGSAGFCGIIYASEDRVMLVDPLTTILNFGWTSSMQMNGSNAKMLQLLRAKAFSLAYECPGCPILTELADYALRVTEGANPIFESDYWEDQIFEGVKERTVLSSHVLAARARRSDHTRYLFEQMYGISIATQLECESYLRSLTTLQHLAGPMQRIFDECLRPAVKCWASFYDNYKVTEYAGCTWAA